MKYLIIIFSSVLIAGCGTYTPIPNLGGGKRFAVEQLLISSTIRNVISDIPLDDLKDKKIFLEVAVIQDEGGGYINGGRPTLSNQLDLRRQNAKSTSSNEVVNLSQNGINTGYQSQDRNYVKDFTFNSSDSKHVSNVLTSYLMRNNIMINPNPDSEGESEFILEIIVDVLGTWVSKTDWFIKNSENIKAIVSAEYVITPLNNKSISRKSGRITYEGEYFENYVGWIGPYEKDIIIKKSDIGNYFPKFSIGSENVDNVKRKKPAELVNPEPNQTIQINPKMR